MDWDNPGLWQSNFWPCLVGFLAAVLHLKSQKPTKWLPLKAVAELKKNLDEAHRRHNF
jgi:hypothetical protein